MREEIRLYDLRQNNYPDKRGDSFRSLQIFECSVCGAITNEVHMGGWPGYGVRYTCPNSAEKWHHNLQDAYTVEAHKAVAHLVKNDIVGEPDMSLMYPRRSLKEK